MRLTKTFKAITFTFKFALMPVLLVGTSQAHAEYTRGDMNFAFYIENDEVVFDYDDGSKLNTRSTRLKVTWDNALNTWLRGGLNLAYLDISQSDNPIESGRNSTGYSLGINLRAIALDRQMLQMDFFFTYDYQATQGSAANQSTDITWNEVTGGMDLTILPHAPAAILLGVSGTGVSGRQKDSGVINRSIGFRGDEVLGYNAGVHIRVDDRGGIGLKAYGGRSKGFYLYFGRRF